MRTTRLATVVVDVCHPDARVDLLGDLVNVTDGRDTSADIYDLPDTGVTDQVADRSLQERPVFPRYVPCLGQHPQDSGRRFPVD
jgi:hypothetical protein